MMNRRRFLKTCTLSVAGTGAVALTRGSRLWAEAAGSAAGQQASLSSPKPSGTAAVKTGGVRMIPIEGGKYRVWTKKVGAGAIKMLTLHGGPGFTHEYFECFEDFLPQHGVEYYYYDQLGSHYSDQSEDTSGSLVTNVAFGGAALRISGAG